jgi:simple sugar transport system permease protein
MTTQAPPKRNQELQLLASIIPILAVILALLGGAVLISISAVSPVAAYLSLAHGAFGSVNNLAETLVKMSPLLLAGLGVAVAFRAKVFNIGAEGQIYMGAIGAAFVGLFLGNLPAAAGIPLALLIGFSLGAIWAGIPAVLKLRLGANEIIVTLMMNYIAIEIVHYLISGPWRDPTTTEPFTARVAQGTQLPVLVSATRLHAGILIAIIAAVVLWWIMRDTILGYQLTLLGANKNAAEYAGVNTSRLILTTMLISGGLAGLAGVGEVSGLHYRMVEGLSPGYGYTAIAIALLGRERPLGVLVASFLFAALVVGADRMQRITGVPIAVVFIIEGLVLIFVMGSAIVHKKVARASA